MPIAELTIKFVASIVNAVVYALEELPATPAAEYLNTTFPPLPFPVDRPPSTVNAPPEILLPDPEGALKLFPTGVADASPLPIIHSPPVFMRPASVWLAVLKRMESVVPDPEVDSNVKVEDADVPPINDGVVTDVPITGEEDQLGAPEFAVNIVFAPP